MEFFSNRTELSLNSVNSGNSGNLINHCRMNWVQFQDPVSPMCLAGAVIASWHLTQEVACLSPFTMMINIFVTELFSESFRKISNIFSFSHQTQALASLPSCRSTTDKGYICFPILVFNYI